MIPPAIPVEGERALSSSRPKHDTTLRAIRGAWSKPTGLVSLRATYAGAWPQPDAGELCPGEAVVAAGGPIAERIRSMHQQFPVREPVKRPRCQQALHL